MCESVTRSAHESRHLIGVRLGGVVRIVPPAVQRIIRRGSGQPSALAVEQSDAHAEGTEINTSNNGQVRLSLPPGYRLQGIGYRGAGCAPPPVTCDVSP